MYLLYSVLSGAALVVGLPYFAYLALRHGKYLEGLGQRFGGVPRAVNPHATASIWIHAVSVGEVLTAKALMADLKARYPSMPLVLSTTTRSGQALAATLGSVDGVFYFPFDFAWCVRRALTRVQPRLFLMVDTELWPNMLRLCRRRRVATALVNGRISSRAFARYRWVRRFFGRVLSDVDRLCVQGQQAAGRLRALGADPARITITGSLKFDALDAVGREGGLDGPDVLRYFRVRPSRLVLVASSTLRGEEAAALRVYAALRGQVSHPLLIVAPRHPERFGEVAQLCQRAGFTTIRRTDLAPDGHPSAEVVVLDTIGELASLYAVATIVFVGGSLVAAGGHNILEPAVFGKPIVFGPHMENFEEIAATFLEADAARQVRSPEELHEVVLELAADAARREALGQAARAVVEANRGARERTLEVLDELFAASGRDRPPPAAGAGARSGS